MQTGKPRQQCRDHSFLFPVDAVRPRREKLRADNLRVLLLFDLLRGLSYGLECVSAYVRGVLQ